MDQSELLHEVAGGWHVMKAVEAVDKDGTRSNHRVVLQRGHVTENRDVDAGAFDLACKMIEIEAERERG